MATDSSESSGVVESGSAELTPVVASTGQPVTRLRGVQTAATRETVTGQFGA